MQPTILLPLLDYCISFILERVMCPAKAKICEFNRGSADFALVAAVGLACDLHGMFLLVLRGNDCGETEGT